MSTPAARPCVAVAYSGGPDSTALLHATLAAAMPLGVGVLALHVHHGLSAHADAWLAHCRQRCRRWAQAGKPLAFAATRIEGAPSRGQSVEAWARTNRYVALRSMALDHAVGLVLLGHHRRDQAETFVLQALRGAGASGLASMPARAEREGITWARPWLAQPREAIEAYRRRHRLASIDDDSNADVRFDRNRLRRVVWPRLVEAFPQAEAVLVDAAERAQEAASALFELAGLDLAAIVQDDGLVVAAWSALSPARRSNALRRWLKERSGRPASSAIVGRLLAELPTCRSARWPVADGELRLHRGLLTWQHAPEAARRVEARGANGRAALLEPLLLPGAEGPPTSLRIVRAGRYAVPEWRGALQATRVRFDGVPLPILSDLRLVARGGAERFQAGPGRPPRSLKKQYQMAGVAAWDRIGPLVYCGERLVFVPRLGIDARVRARAGEPQLRLDWRDDVDDA